MIQPSQRVAVLHNEALRGGLFHNDSSVYQFLIRLYSSGQGFFSTFNAASPGSCHIKTKALFLCFFFLPLDKDEQDLFCLAKHVLPVAVPLASVRSYLLQHFWVFPFIKRLAAINQMTVNTTSLLRANQTLKRFSDARSRPICGRTVNFLLGY